MIRAAEILGEVRPPKWRGPSTVVRHLTNADERNEDIAEAPAPRPHRSKAEAEQERPLWAAIGAAMLEARKRAGWNQGRAADRMDISNRMLCDYERGRYAVPQRSWDAVRQVLGVDIAAMVAEWRARA